MGKKLLLLSIVTIAATLGGGLAFAWNRVTAKPMWYDANALTPDVSLDLGESARDVIARKLAADTDGDAQQEVTFSATEVTQLVAQAVVENTTTAEVLEASQGLSTHIADDQIESGAVINFSDISSENLSSQNQHVLGQLMDKFPMLANQDVYIGIASQPQIVNGQLQLGDDAVVKVGGLALPLSEVTDQLGLSQADVERQLTQLLTQQGIVLEEIHLVDGQITLAAPAR